jgi:hypothetical protein
MTASNTPSTPMQRIRYIERVRCIERPAHLAAHDGLELGDAELAVEAAEGAVGRDAREVRLREVDPRVEVLAAR